MLLHAVHGDPVVPVVPGCVRDELDVVGHHAPTFEVFRVELVDEARGFARRM